jgi:hypothetical protein
MAGHANSRDPLILSKLIAEPLGVAPEGAIQIWRFSLNRVQRGGSVQFDLNMVARGE